jgi:hypothetical protein
MKKTLLACAVLVACGGAANLAGNYSVSIVNGQNGCNFANWTVGQTATAIPFTVVQSGGAVTGTVTGAVGSYLTLLFGSNVFTGTIAGDAFDMKLFGTRSATTGNCLYTVNAELTGSIAGDFVSGNIAYSTATNGSPDCGALMGCHSDQSFNGSRPPAH